MTTSEVVPSTTGVEVPTVPVRYRGRVQPTGIDWATPRPAVVKPARRKRGAL